VNGKSYLISQLNRNNYVILPITRLYSSAQIKFLKSNFDLFGSESVLEGDRQESTQVEVRRFRIDKPNEKPKIPYSFSLKWIFSRGILDVLKTGKYENGLLQAKEFYDSLLPGWFIRRAQSHEYKPGYFVSLHTDSESNPNYRFAVNLNLSEKPFKGGLFQLMDPSSKQLINIPVKPGEMVITPCNVPHEVTHVEKGNRRSLAFFLSTSPINNKNPVKNLENLYRKVK
jgi:hypothetical protein